MADSLRKPSLLRPGDVIRVVAPASPFDPAALEAGIEVLASWGFEPRHRADIFDRRDYFAGSPRRRAAELHEAFEDDDCAAIIAVRGGYGVATVLPLLDPSRVSTPKVVCGCSDLTALLGWCVQRASTVAVHGPMVASLGRGQDPAGAERLRRMLTRGGKPEELRSTLPDTSAWCLSPGHARGRSLGGSLSILASLCGTPWQVDTAGAVLFLEDVGERPYRIDRLLVQLQQAGAFDRVAGVVLGDFTGCDDDGGPSARAAITRVLREHSIPVLAGVPFGHGNPNLAFPLGVQVEVDATAGVVRFRESALG